MAEGGFGVVGTPSGAASGAEETSTIAGESSSAVSAAGGTLFHQWRLQMMLEVACSLDEVLEAEKAWSAELVSAALAGKILRVARRHTQRSRSLDSCRSLEDCHIPELAGFL